MTPDLLRAVPAPACGLPPDWLVAPSGPTGRFAAAGFAISDATPTYVRHKPGETTLVGFRLTTAEGTTGLAYARWCADADRAAALHAKALSLRPHPSDFGPGVALLDPHTVVYGFPNDARLRRMRWYGTRRKLAHTFSQVDLGAQVARKGHDVSVLRYKPERRLVASARISFDDGTAIIHHVPGGRATAPTRSVLIRYTTTCRAPALARTGLALTANAVATPAPLGQLEQGRVAIDAFVEGEDLTDAVRAGRSDPTAFALDLARFHTTPPPPDSLDGPHIPDRTLVRVRDGLAAHATWAPSVAPAAGWLAEELARTCPIGESPVLLHGDLDGGNVRFDGTTNWFIDLERVGVGPAAADLGRYLAHALTLDLLRPGWSPGAVEHAAAVIDAYRLHHPVSDRSLAWHTATSLVDRALLASRQLQPDWPDHTRRLIAAARNRLTAPNQLISPNENRTVGGHP